MYSSENTEKDKYTGVGMVVTEITELGVSVRASFLSFSCFCDLVHAKRKRKQKVKKRERPGTISHV